MVLNWNVSCEEQALITRIGQRAYELTLRLGVWGDWREHPYPKLDVMMDVTAVHANGNPLRLRELLAADDGDFAHDVFGIRRFLNRDTGELDCFRPRFRA